MKSPPNFTLDDTESFDLVILERGVSDTAVAYFSKPRSRPIHIAMKAADFPDLSFMLKNKSKIRSFTITTSVDNVDWETIHQLENIESMFIGGATDCREFDPDRLPKVWRIRTISCPGIVPKLNEFESLRYIWLDNMKSADLSCMNKQKNLEGLYIHGSRSFETLEGIQDFSHLSDLRIYGCSKLDGIDPLEHAIELRSLSLRTNNKVFDYTPIKNLVNLDYLHIFNDKVKIKTASWIRSLSKLRCLDLVIKVEDGNLNFLYDMESLRSVGFSVGRHSNVKQDEFDEYMKKKGYVNDSHELDVHPFGREL